MKKNYIKVLVWSVFWFWNHCAFSQTITGKSNTVSVDYSDKPAVVPVVSQLGVPSTPKYHALIIGVSDYQFAGAQLPNLDKPVHDAGRLREILNLHYAFSSENTTLLTNPTREDIINSFDQLSRTISDKDNLLIFYAGHGYYDKSSDFGFWLPSNAKTTSRADWIANSSLA